jgi:hypothetical protein
MDTIGDRLDAHTPEPIKWARYAGGWDDAVGNKASKMLLVETI